MASPLHYIFQAAMGQCSTLPTDTNKTEGRAPMSPSSHTTSRRGYRQQREESDTYGRVSDDTRRQPDGDVVMGDGHSRSSRNVAKESSQKSEPFMDDVEATHPSQSYHSARSSRSSSKARRGVSSRPTSVAPQEFFPPPPEGSIRTRCYRLNLDVPIILSPTHDTLGPFNYSTPNHLISTTREGISMAKSSESVEKTTTQIAIDTARIFRGIKVDNNGTIISRNDRASKSRRSNTTAKVAEHSRQSAKINKANDLVDEMVSSGKENDGEKPNMISVIPIGEYDDMKQLVRDGSKKLREAEGKGDEWIMSLNHTRGSSRSRRTDSTHPVPSSSTSRRRLSPSYSQYSDVPGAALSNSSRTKPRSKISQSQPNGAPPPRIKGHPRDHPSRRLERGENPRYGGNCNNMSIFSGADSDWSDALNFNSIWNCGGNGGTTMSPSNTTGPDASNNRSSVRYEGRNESSTRFSKAASERDAPMIR
eukprot:scaffold10203_cov272-Chaetoceros_neogracile.AAC.61